MQLQKHGAAAKVTLQVNCSVHPKFCTQVSPPLPPGNWSPTWASNWRIFYNLSRFSSLKFLRPIAGNCKPVSYDRTSPREQPKERAVTVINLPVTLAPIACDLVQTKRARSEAAISPVATRKVAWRVKHTDSAAREQKTALTLTFTGSVIGARGARYSCSVRGINRPFMF